MRRIDAHVDGDTWEGSFAVDACGTWQYSIEAWIDPLASWRHEVHRKLDGGQTDLAGELSEGALLIAAAARARQGQGRDAAGRRRRPRRRHRRRPGRPPRCRARAGRRRRGRALPRPHRRRRPAPSPAIVKVERERARFSSWYELFPRSWGGFEGVRKVVPQIAELGFDVLYFTPIHPIGNDEPQGQATTRSSPAPATRAASMASARRTAATRRSRPSSARSRTSRRSSPTCQEHGIEIALDIALQCSPDHPWLKEHPEWFFHRPDGTLKYAENPPKKYQDIYNVNFQSEDWRGLWDAWLEIFRLWVGHGVRVFRVDNPHTKPVAFWEWLIAEVHSDRPRRDLPDRGVHAPGDDARAGQGGLQPVLHVLHLEELEVGARGVRHRAASTRPPTTSGPTSSPTRPTSCTPTCSTAAARPSRRGWCWPAR